MSVRLATVHPHVESLSAVDRKDAATTIDIDDLFNVKVSTIANAQFKDSGKDPSSYKKELEGICQARFIPRTKDLFRLYYLAQFNKGDKCPFTEDEVNIFRASRQASLKTNRWLKLAIVPFSLISGTGFVSYTSVSDDLTPGQMAAVMGSVALVSGVAINMLSLWITGTNPNDSKDADDTKQDTLLNIERRYNELAFELIDQHKQSPDFAKSLAEKIDFDKILQSALNCDLEAAKARRVFAFFKSALRFIKEGKLPKQHLLKNYILNGIIVS